MNTPNAIDELKLLVLDRIKEPSRANAVMELIANKQGDEALMAVIDEMETIDIARIFTQAFDYTKPNQAAGLIRPDVAADCILAILARWSINRIQENPKAAAQDINDFLASVILNRAIEAQAEFKTLVEDHMDLITACMLCDLSYHGDEIVQTILQGEQGTMAEIVKNLNLTEMLVRSVKSNMQKDFHERPGDSDDNHFDSDSEERRVKFVRSTLKRYHKEATSKFVAESADSMEDFMAM